MTDATKLCKSCGEVKPCTEFYRATRLKDGGFQSKCKACDKQTGAKYRANNPDKWIAKNERWNAANKDRRNATIAKWQATNRERVRATTAAWAVANKERRSATNARWRKENQEKVKEKSALWKAENPDRHAANIKRWQADNPEKRAAIAARWLAANLDKRAVSGARRRAHKLNATPVWANSRYIKLFYSIAKDESQRTGVKIHVDHIVPLQSRIVCGLHCEQNLQLLFVGENSKKGNRVWPDMP
jgi:hypothetical protein